MRLLRKLADRLADFFEPSEEEVEGFQYLNDGLFNDELFPDSDFKEVASELNSEVFKLRNENFELKQENAKLKHLIDTINKNIQTEKEN